MKCSYVMLKVYAWHNLVEILPLGNFVSALCLLCLQLGWFIISCLNHFDTNSLCDINKVKVQFVALIIALTPIRIS